MKISTKLDSNKNKILILGANGFLGSNIIQLRSRNKIIFKDFYSSFSIEERFFIASMRDDNFLRGSPKLNIIYGRFC